MKEKVLLLGMFLDFSETAHESNIGSMVISIAKIFEENCNFSAQFTLLQNGFQKCDSVGKS